ncbi:hypothetical protein D9Q98_001295 [Chlorella vulgaris]|uniref:TraB domain-containing protein n=1 Tax=Chlorella vulgaris TaxID=3077 RepID=A0A9D4Z2H7_CHLVU|nr:hypothetical protein D9Q98_001295 [Chlorella vulgaris]
MDRPENDCVTLLKHPSGSQVYIIGTAHVSRKAAEDVAALISRVSPVIVVLELDEQRQQKLIEQAQEGDKYGLNRLRKKSTWEIVRMGLSGEGLQYFMSAMYTVTGAVVGTMPGGEFLAALEAAQGVGAQVVLGDRDQNATLKRLSYYTRYLTRQDSRSQADMRRLRNMMDSSRKEDGGSGPRIDSPTSMDVGRQPDFMQREPPPTRKEMEVEEEVRQSRGSEDPWGVGPGEDTEVGMRRRLLEMMKQGGCPQPNKVLEAAQRIFRDGMDPSGSIKPTDILTVRECGNSIVDTFRLRAIKGDSTWMQRLEQEQVAGAKGAAGMELSNTAMRKVLVDERDLILARRLWEAGLEAGSQPVVGVVGAGHLKGIEHYWPEAGADATEATVQQYMQAPREDKGSPWLTGAVGAAVLGTIGYRRPKAAAMFAGAVAFATAPYFGFMIVTVNRFSKFASKLVNTVEMMDAGGEGSAGGFAEDTGMSWAAEGNGSTSGTDSEWK